MLPAVDDGCTFSSGERLVAYLGRVSTSGTDSTCGHVPQGSQVGVGRGGECVEVASAGLGDVWRSHVR